MTLKPRIRKLLLTAHVVSSVGWMGAVAAYLALVVAALTSDNDETVRAAFRSMELIYVILVPLAVTALATGLVQALGTTWGLFRHYWVILKLLLTVLATSVLLLHMASVSALADKAAKPGGAVPDAGGELLHAGVGQLVLLATAILGIYKPRGMTRYGQRKNRELRARAEDCEREAHAA
jgi:uncharacterized membrane protein